MHSIVLLTTATVIFRCDILVFLGPFTLQLLVSREVRFYCCLVLRWPLGYATELH